MTDSKTPGRKTLGIKTPSSSDAAPAKKTGATRPVRVSDLNRKRVQAVQEGIRQAKERAGKRKPQGGESGERAASPARNAGGGYGDRPPRREGDARPPRRFDGDSRPPRRFEGDSRPPRRDDDARPPRRYGDDEGRPPRRFDNDSRPPRRFDNDSRPPRREGDARPPRPYGNDEGRPPRRFDGDSRPPRRFDNDSRPPRRDGDARPPRPYGNDEGRPPRRFDNDSRPPRREGDARPPRPYGNDEGRPPRRFDGDSRPPRRFDNDSRPPRREGDARPPRPYGNDEGRPPRRFDNDSRPPRRDGDARPPRPYGNDEGRPPRRFDGDDRPPRRFDNDSRPPRREGDARPPRRDSGDRPAPTRERRFSDNADRARPAPRPPAAAPRGEDHASARAEDDGLVRLSKRMSELGLCSRREADEWIPRGWVLVDGKPITELGTRIRPDAEIEILQAARSEQGERVTVLLNKPIGYVSGQAEDGYEPAAVLFAPENQWENDPTRKRFAPWQRKNLAPAGRLDIDSTGLLVLTQDGRVARALIGDDSTVEKEYLVRVVWQSPQGDVEHKVSEVFPPEQLDLLRHGLSLDGVVLKPAKVSWQNEEQLRFVLREGRKRQIRRMCEQVGLKVVGLKRVRMGRIVLGDLPVGQWRFLGPFEKF
ncbi:pseudouridine synthase [Cupriavidus pauculus]|uniref:Dual-specificity RNA pseudouridine synthase RluF n=1 Tax=Cupriavidus pauculus TaxID=82633 RepID=A0A5P2H3N7_9BURK|nr:pseudouridine synthase [Cupriavidus pauculus]QET01930.1 pseudouridine synthase [Cupriavidus pauculus]